MQAYAPLFPALAVGLAALVALFADVLDREKPLAAAGLISALGLVVAAVPLARDLGAADASLFAGTWVSDGMGRLAAGALLLYGLVLIGISWRRRVVARGEEEYFGLLMLSLFGALMLIGANDLTVLYLGIEMTTMPLYAMVGFSSLRRLGGEGALKYFIQGLLASLVMVYGMSMLYGVTGTTQLAAIAQQANTFAAGRAQLFAMSLVLVAVGFLFKLAAAPFHFWAPDVYEGASTPVTAAVASIPKIAALVALVRVFPIALADAQPRWTVLFAVLATVSMFAGNLVAYAQTNVKRMLAYSAVAHAGYLLVGIATATPAAADAAVFYVIVYGLASLAAFGVLAAVGAETLADLEGLGKGRPFLALAMLVAVLSLIGLPPLGGFIGKLLLFGAAIDAGLVWLAVIGVVNSAISAGYYFMIVRSMFFVVPAKEAAVADVPAGVAVGACVAGLLLTGLAFGPLVAFLSRAASGT